MALNSKKNIIIFFILLNLFGFPMVVAINLYLGISTSIGSIFYRALIVICSIILLGNSIKIKKTFNPQVKILSLFWIFYSIRLIYDLSFRELHLKSPHYDSESIIYLFAFFSILIPMLALITNSKSINFHKLSPLLLKVSFFQCILILLGLYKLFGLNITQLAAERYLFTQADIGNNQTGGSPLNPILVSRCGSILILLIANNFLFQKTSVHFTIKYLSIPLGLLLIILGGSRGPLLSTLVILFIMYVLFLYKNKSNIGKITQQIFLTALSAYVLFLTYHAFSDQIGIFDRFNESDSSNSIDTGRSEHWDSAINQFIDNPFLGDQIFDKHLWIYPHNLVLESFMALGMVGGFIFLFLIIKNLSKYQKILKYYTVSFPILILFAIFLMFAMSSGGLYNSTEFWISITLISILEIKPKNLIITN